MAIRDLSQFHENPVVVAWWVRTGGRALVWLTPAARRRGILAAAAVPIGIVMTINAVARHKGLLFPVQDLGLALVVAAQFVLLWLVYRAAVGFAHLPAPVRRHPQLALHASYWLLLAVVWGTAPASSLWRQVLIGLAVVYPMLLWRLGYLLLGGQQCPSGESA